MTVFVVEKVSEYGDWERHEERSVVWAGVDKEAALAFVKAFKVSRTVSVQASVWENGECIDDNPQEFFVPEHCNPSNW